MSSERLTISLKKRHFIILLLIVLLATPFSFTSAQQTVSTQKVLIGFSSQPGVSEEQLIRQNGGTITHAFHFIPVIAAIVPEAAIPGLLRNPRITYIEQDGQLKSADAELDNTWGVAKIGSGAVHATGVTGAGVKVAVIDSGIDYNHPDLVQSYAGGYDFVNNDTDPMDDLGHGTHVAGTMAAADNNLGVVGVAPGVQLYALKVLNASDFAFWSDVARALEWSVDNGIQVTNTSLVGDTGSQTMQIAYDNAYAQGLLHVASAGNSGTCDGKKPTVTYPAKYSSIISVAAIDQTNLRPCWSSTGKEVTIAAPGVNINSTLLGGGYGLMNGTSMASPHVAGSAALLIAAGIIDKNGNGYINDEIRTVLTKTATDIGPLGIDTFYGSGLVNVQSAVASLSTSTGTPATTATVKSIVYAPQSTRPNNKNLLVTLLVQNNLNQNISGATVSAQIYLGSTLLVNGTGVTDTTGKVTFTVQAVTSGCYTTVVTAVQSSTLTWDGLTPANTYCK